LHQTATAIKDTYQTPVYVYSEAALQEQARKALLFPSAHGLTVRFAIKACPNAAVLQVCAVLC
jgi:diaminopimelate decarboxylase